MEATESVLFHERSLITLPSEHLWSCLHCSDYFQNLARRKAVMLHAQTVLVLPSTLYIPFTDLFEMLGTPYNAQFKMLIFFL